MANSKTGFLYYAVETDRYEDIRIKRLKKDFSTDGIAIYDKVLCEIYRVKGYFIVWEQSIAFEVADYFDKPEALIDGIIKHCCLLGLFNKKLFEAKGVLTSMAIQKRYLDWSRRAKRSTPKILSAFKLQEESDIVPEEWGKLPEESTKLPEVCPEVKESNITKRKEEEKGLPPPHEFFEGILQDKIFTEPVMSLHRIDEQKLESLLRRFFASKKMLHEDSWTGLSDCRKNFLNWIPFELNAGAKTIGDLKKNGTSVQNYQSPKVPEEPEDPVELERKNKTARESFRNMIEQDAELISVNENAVLKFSAIKFDILLDDQAVEYTPEEKQQYVQLARDERIRELNLRFDQATRMILRHYDSGKTPDSERRQLTAMAKEFAYRDYLKKKVSITNKPQTHETTTT